MRVALLLLPFLLGACAIRAEPARALAGTNWRFVSIDDAPAVSQRASMEFRKDGLGANVGCNGIGGNWHIQDDRLIAGPLIRTEMYCEGPVWNQEEAIIALLSAAPRFQKSGDLLILRSSGHSAELRRVVSP